MSHAYYNELDPYAAQWLRNLIVAGHIAPGDVDERSILDVCPDDLRGYTQCHFFAGIGVWSYALRLAGWPDDREVWTGSCPCQPFSAAGKGGGFDDERHLWPAFYHLISERRPAVVFGEQVASKDGLAWLDLVQTDLEAAGYALGPFDLCAAGFGAPHIRQRLYFVADYDRQGRHRVEAARVHERREAQSCGESAPRDANGALWNDSDRRGGARELADSDSSRRGAGRTSEAGDGRGPAWVESAGLRTAGDVGDAAWRGFGMRGGAQGEGGRAAQSGAADIVEHAEHARLEGHGGHGDDGHEPGRDGAHALGSVAEAGATHGFWRDADWLPCIDGKTRPVESGTFPLAHGAPARVGRLRAYGNCIVAPQAAEFIAAYLALRT